MPSAWSQSIVAMDTMAHAAATHQPATKKETDSRRWRAVAAGMGVAYGGTLVLLNEAWYKQYPRTAFQTFNDSREWLQVDKLGHAWSTYQLARGTTAVWQWAGMPEKKAIWLGAAGSMGFLTIIELLDAHSAQWGWSWADMAANTGGILLYAGQQLGWKEQRIQLKFSVAPRSYPPGLQPRADALFGASLPERMLKDYNHQTYWLSVNPSAFLSHSRMPRWLNLAVGYGASGMFGGFTNKAYNDNGDLVFDRTDIPRLRQWYLSPDIDLTRIRTNHKGLRTALLLLNCIKLPAPALMLEGGKLQLQVIAR